MPSHPRTGGPPGRRPLRRTSTGRQVPVLADVLPGGRIRDVALVTGYAAAMAGAGRVSIDLPGTPVPVSAQSLVVLTGAVALGPVRTTTASILHTALGAGGVDGFVPRSRATRGYVVGLHLAAIAVAKHAAHGRARTFRQVAAAAAVGHVGVLTAGAAWMAYDRRLDTAETWRRAVRPFLPGAVVKSAACATAVSTMWRLADTRPR